MPGGFDVLLDDVEDLAEDLAKFTVADAPASCRDDGSDDDDDATAAKGAQEEARAVPTSGAGAPPPRRRPSAL